MEMLILELISILSLTFSLLTVLFEVPALRGIALFLYVVLVFCFYLWKKPEGKFSQGVLVALLCFPWLLERTQENAFFTALYTTVFILYYYRKLGRLYPEDLSFRFRVTYGILFVITLIGTGNDFMGRLVGRALPYMLLYFFTTVILTTSLRHRQAGLDQKKTRRNIFFYLSLTSVFSLVVTIGELRSGALEMFRFLYEAFLGVLYYVAYPIVYAGFWIFMKFIDLLRSLPPGEEPQEEQALESFTDAFQESVQEIRSTPLLDTLIPLIMVLVVIFLIVRFMKGRRGKMSQELPFEEVREFILDEREKGRRGRREKLPRTPREKIRFYYRRYLRSIRQHVNIEKSDTSLIVAEKGKEIFHRSQEIRSIYASIRYSDRKADEKMVETFRDFVEEEEK